MKHEKAKDIEMNTNLNEKPEVVEGEQKEENLSEEVDKLKEENRRLVEELNTLNEKLVELEDSYKRKVADFDNYRKRMLKQIEDSKKEGIKEFVKELLPVMDNFEKALNVSDSNKDFDNLYSGLKIIYSLMSNLFNKYNIKTFDSVGMEFDHNLHEAIMMEERDNVEFNHTVLEEFEKGYFFDGDILRHAKVKVAKKKNNN
ncbi:MAG: nucleotide exchange factor GrpE [Brevinematia bacterium]